MKIISTMNEGEYFQAAADAMQSSENATLEYLCDLMKSASETTACYPELLRINEAITKPYTINGVLVFIFALLLLIFPLSAVAGKASSFDIVTMTNGDSHQGTVAVESLSVNTGFGKISIPYHRLHSLKRGADKLPDLLTTRQGERFCGQIVESDMTMLRVLDATLTLATGDIAAISFASRGIRTSRRQTPDVIKSRFGDQFVARVLTRNLLFKTPTSLEIIDTGEIRFIDSMIPDEEDAPSTQITLAGGISGVVASLGTLHIGG